MLHLVLPMVSAKLDACYCQCHCRCPGLVIRPMRTARYREVAFQLHQLLTVNFSPTGVVEKASYDDFYIDITPWCCCCGANCSSSSSGGSRGGCSSNNGGGAGGAAAAVGSGGNSWSSVKAEGLGLRGNAKPSPEWLGRVVEAWEGLGEGNWEGEAAGVAGMGGGVGGGRGSDSSVCPPSVDKSVPAVPVTTAAAAASAGGGSGGGCDMSSAGPSVCPPSVADWLSSTTFLQHPPSLSSVHVVTLKSGCGGSSSHSSKCCTHNTNKLVASSSNNNTPAGAAFSTGNIIGSESSSSSRSSLPADWGLVEGPLKTGVAVAQVLREAVARSMKGMTVSCGVAAGKLLARLVGPCHKPNAVTVLPASVGVQWLRGWGIVDIPQLRGKRGGEVVEKLGVRTAGELGALGLGVRELEGIFGGTVGGVIGVFAAGEWWGW